MTRDRLMDDLKQRFTDAWERGEGMTLEAALRELPDAGDRREFARFAISVFEGGVGRPGGER